jgi:hypothetical protein
MVWLELMEKIRKVDSATTSWSLMVTSWGLVLDQELGVELDVVLQLPWVFLLVFLFVEVVVHRMVLIVVASVLRWDILMAIWLEMPQEKWKAQNWVDWMVK